MQVENTEIADVKVITPRKFGDHRGFFSETYSKSALADAGVAIEFQQDNHSYSAEVGILRGLHFQIPPFGQVKLVRVAQGSIFDVAVDLRQGSPSYGKWVGRTISAEAWNQILVPVGFAHGFCTLEPYTEVLYKVSTPYSPEHERGLAWDDPAVAIAWPLEGRLPVLSEKDGVNPTLAELPVYFES